MTKLNLKVSQFSITERTSVISYYLNDVSKYHLINAEKEVVLVRKAKKGDIEARNELICANLRFVISVANEHKKKYPFSELSDLINAGNLGLIKAIERFDDTKGFKLITYAVSWIKQSMIDLSYKQDRVISLPYNAIELINKIKKVKASFEKENDRNPTLEELSQITGKSVKNILAASQYSIPAFSLDYKNNEEEKNLYDVLEDKNAPNPFRLLEVMSGYENVQRLLSVLSDVQKEIIVKNFGIGYEKKTISEIAFEMKIPKETVENIKTVAFRKLRKCSYLEKIKEQVLAS
ncbi:TPA: RNA polymerase subunit sigma [Candidatus Nomurabacteria bacterium]|nr:MAG: hypothetical protein O210_OD1C00001G0353 [Parcubacteria bacterium RAAC4_OD1_1]HCY26410.1 RNA polymerase subunit sigma [Candidatus Nomurabacteria bacterium]